MLDGVDLREFKQEELRQMITVQFQTSIQYATTAGENISYGELQIPATSDAVVTAATAAQAEETIRQLPDGYRTQLGTWFDGGCELSIGEWRRISLARALYRPAPIVLLHEPTSAMDSWAEAKWMIRFRKAFEGRTAIIITHRFLTAMYADVIHVMQDGRITESGSHDELLQLDGLYAESWRNQTRAGGQSGGLPNSHDVWARRNDEPGRLVIVFTKLNPIESSGRFPPQRLKSHGESFRTCKSSQNRKAMCLTPE